MDTTLFYTPGTPSQSNSPPSGQSAPLCAHRLHIASPFCRCHRVLSAVRSVAVALEVSRVLEAADGAPRGLLGGRPRPGPGRQRLVGRSRQATQQTRLPLESLRVLRGSHDPREGNGEEQAARGRLSAGVSVSAVGHVGPATVCATATVCTTDGGSERLGGRAAGLCGLRLCGQSREGSAQPLAELLVAGGAALRRVHKCLHRSVHKQAFSKLCKEAMLSANQETVGRLSPGRGGEP